MVYDVHLENFEGPLDLLLYLIKKDDLEIAEIPIAQITAEYLGYLELMKELNLEVAGEFLVMASTLMQIKARTLLPSSVIDEEEGPNPLEELKTKLLEYQKFKEVSKFLSGREAEYSQVYYRSAPDFSKDDFILEVTLFDLIDSFKDVLKELPAGVKEIVYKEIPIEHKIREILDLLEGKSFITFREILGLQQSRQAMITCFLAVLELVRLKQVVGRQSDYGEDIRIYRIGEAETLPEEAREPELMPGPEPVPASEQLPEPGEPDEAPAEGGDAAGEEAPVSSFADDEEEHSSDGSH